MRKWIIGILIVIFSCGLLISAGALGKYYWESYQQQSRFDELAALHPSVSRPDPVNPTADPTQDTSDYEKVENPSTGETVLMRSDFSALYALNSDLVGWLEIPGTDINYPVMQTPKDAEYYLRRDFDKNDSRRGCLFVHGGADVFAPSDNVTIYGHNMKDGTMFAQLNKFTDKSFYENNSYIYFDTLSQIHAYQVMAVFRTTATKGEGFDYYNFVNAQDAAEYDNFVATCKDMSLYDTGVEAAFGDALITLSTCEYSQENGRLVIVAKQVY